MSHHQATEQNHIKVASKYFENVAEFKYLGVTAIIKIEFMRKTREANFKEFLLPQNSKYCPICSTRNTKIKMHKTTIIPLFCFIMKLGLPCKGMNTD